MALLDVDFKAPLQPIGRKKVLVDPEARMASKVLGGLLIVLVVGTIWALWAWA